MTISTFDGRVSVYVPGFRPIATIRAFHAARKAFRAGITPEQIIEAARGTGMIVRVNGKEIN